MIFLTQTRIINAIVSMIKTIIRGFKNPLLITKNNIMKNIKFNLETIIKVVIVTFIIVTLTLVTIELFSDLTLLNRAI